MPVSDTFYEFKLLEGESLWLPPPSGNFVTVHIQYNSLLSIFNALSGNWMDYVSHHHNSGCSGTDLINWGVTLDLMTYFSYRIIHLKLQVDYSKGRVAT